MDISLPASLFDSGSIVVFKCSKLKSWPFTYISDAGKSHGLEFNSSVNASLEDLLVTPPFDVISALGESGDISDVTIKIKNARTRFVHLKWVCSENQVSGVLTFRDDLMRERLELVLASSRLGIWDWNPKTSEVHFDEQWCNMLGWKKEEMSNSVSEWSSRVHPDDLDACFKDITAHIDGKSDFYENLHRMKHRDGRWLYILDRGRVMERDEQGQVIRFTGTHTDITNEKLAQMKLEEQFKAYVESNERKEDILRFLSSLSHEIRTPILAIGATLETCGSKMESISKDQEESMKSIGESCESLLVLASEVDEYSRLLSGSFKVRKLPFYLLDIPREAVHLFSAICEQKQITLNATGLDGYEQTHPIASGDPFLFLRVLVTIMSNAVKFTPKNGSIELSCRIHDWKPEQGEHHLTLEVVVKDTGVGMSKSDLEAVRLNMERFAPVYPRDGPGEASQAPDEGIRIGLKNASTITKLLRGSLEIDSEGVSLGTTVSVSVTLPKADSECDAASIQDWRNQIEENMPTVYLSLFSRAVRNSVLRSSFDESTPDPWVETIRNNQEGETFESFVAKHSILVVDDSMLNCKVIRTLLLRLGAGQVTFCENGEKCLQMLQEKKYGFVILDFMMPVMDGPTACMKLRELEKASTGSSPFCSAIAVGHLPVLGLTADTVVSYQKWKSCGMDAALTKPTTCEVLREAMTGIMKKHNIIS
jgi:PAS domain S-box-containing protein